MHTPGDDDDDDVGGGGRAEGGGRAWMNVVQLRIKTSSVLTGL